jgi:hypothetical protein
MTGRAHSLEPVRGGLLVEVEALDLLRRLPDGSCQLVYLDPPFHPESQFSDDASEEKSGALEASYLQHLHDLLLHARRVLARTGNLFVYYPSHHASVDLGAALAQLFGREQTFHISVPARPVPLQRPGVPRSDTATVFLARGSADATYHPPLQDRTFAGDAQEDQQGRFRWEVVDVPSTIAPGRVFEFEGVSLAPGRAWRFSRERMTTLLGQGRLVKSTAGRWRLKRYEHELAPFEMSLEWTDLSTFVPPSERAVVGHERHQGPQEPLTLMNRIVEMGSDPGDLVAVLSFGGAGTGAVASHALGRRWVANSSPRPIADWVRARMVTAGAIEGQDFAVVAEDQALAEPVLPANDVPLLFTADQMRESARHTASLRQMVARSFEDAVERGLAEHLLLHGVIAVHGFRPPGSDVEIDVFLPGPPFGVVEVKSGEPSRRGGIEHLARCGRLLSADTRLYLVLFDKTDAPASVEVDADTGVVIVRAAEGDWAGAAPLVAEDHQTCRMRLGAQGDEPSDFIVDLASDEDELTRELSHLTMNLDPLFLADGRAVLEHEIRHLRDEIGHGHFTAAALRVGRSLEFIVYEACRSWGVEVREPILVGLTKLDNSKKELARRLIDYANTDAGGSDTDRAKKSVIKAAQNLQSIVLEIISDVDNNTATGQSDARPTRNPQALINDIAQTHSRLKEVRDASHQIAASVDQLLKLRNAAAHASTDGDAREVSREELSTMIGCLSQALLGLSRCGTAVLASRHGEPT